MTARITCSSLRRLLSQLVFSGIYPLWPALIRAEVRLFGDSSPSKAYVISSLLLANALLFLGLVLFYRVVVVDWRRREVSQSSADALSGGDKRFRREHCGDKPASVGVLSWVHFLSVSLPRVLVFRFVDEANARASNKPSHSDLDLRTLCCRCFGAALESRVGSPGIGFGSAAGHEWTICFYDEIWIRPYFRSLSPPVFFCKVFHPKRFYRSLSLCYGQCKILLLIQLITCQWAG